MSFDSIQYCPLDAGPYLSTFSCGLLEDTGTLCCNQDEEEGYLPLECPPVSFGVALMPAIHSMHIPENFQFGPQLSPALNETRMESFSNFSIPFSFSPAISAWDVGYLRKDIGGSATLGARLSVLNDWATALNAYHGDNVVYGTLTPASVSMAHGRGTLQNPNQEWTPDEDVYSARWAATELFHTDDNSLPTKMSDVYSFGCLMLQVLTGTEPHGATKRPEQVVYLKYLGREPIDNQTPKVPDHYVAFLRWCWSSEPEKRPTMEAIASFLHEEIKKAGDQ